MTLGMHRFQRAVLGGRPDWPICGVASSKNLSVSGIIFRFGLFRWAVFRWRNRLQQARSNEFLRKRVDVFSVAFSSNAGGDNQNDYLFVVNAIDDAVTLADGADAMVPIEFCGKRLSLLLRFFSKTVNRLDDFCPNAAVLHFIDHA